MNHVELIHASWVKRDRMNMSLLYAAYADSRDRIQLEAVYKAFQYGTGCREQAHLFKKNKIKLQEIRSVGLNGSERT